MGDAGAQAVELAGILQELDDLFQLVLLFVGAGHIGKGGLALVLGLVLDLGAAHVHDAAALAAAVHGVEHEHHAAHQHDHQQDVEPGHLGPGRDVVIDHGRIGVRLVVLVDVVLHVVHEHARIGQPVGDVVDAFPGGKDVLGGLLAAHHGAEQALGAVEGLLLFGGSLLHALRQGHLALFQGKTQVAGVQVHLEAHHLIGLEVVHHLGVRHAHPAGSGGEGGPQVERQQGQRQQHGDVDAVEFWSVLQKLISYPREACPRVSF